MKKYLLGILLVVSAFPAYAQRTHRPCQVAAVDNFNRVIARFYGQTDWRSGMCRNALRQCNFEIRRRGWWGARCVQLRTRW